MFRKLLAALLIVSTIGVEPREKGEDSLQEHCAGCHGADLQGGNGYPSLLEVSTDLQPQDVVRVLLNGKFSRGGEIQGHTIAVMPQLDSLSDADIASLVNALYRQRSDKGTAPLRPVRSITAEEVRIERLLGHEDRSLLELSPQEYDSAAALYFEHCAGCHGVRRQGGGGGALHSWTMDAVGSQYLQAKLHFGSPIGMPGWGSSNKLSEEDVSLMVRFLQAPAPPAPVFDATDVMESWRELRELSSRPKRRQFDVKSENLFVSLLHNKGQIALIDGVTKKIRAIIDVNMAPHDVAVSASGRYLYVMSRGAEICLIDLYLENPAVVAAVRVGIEGRALSVGRKKRNGYAIAGAYWPPQFTVLDPQTLKPLLTQLVDSSAYELGRSARDISQVVNLPRSNEFALLTKVEGTIELLSLSRKGRLRREVESVLAEPLLRAGGFDLSGRYLLVPVDNEEVVVFDGKQREVVTVVEAPGLLGGSSGSPYIDPEFGPVWAVGSVLGDSITVIGTDPVNHSEVAWRVVRRLVLPGTGSLHAVTHPNSSNLWFDLPLSADPVISENGYLINLKKPGSDVKQLPIAHWANVDGERARILQPQYNAAGDEVWFTVWNDSEQRSAIVVVNDKTLELIQVIDDERLLTPTRTFSVASLMQAK